MLDLAGRTRDRLTRSRAPYPRDSGHSVNHRRPPILPAMHALSCLLQQLRFLRLWTVSFHVQYHQTLPLVPLAALDCVVVKHCDFCRWRSNLSHLLSDFHLQYNIKKIFRRYRNLAPCFKKENKRCPTDSPASPTPAQSSASRVSHSPSSPSCAYSGKQS